MVADTVITNAVKILRDGGLVAMPTETVYGLGADALNPLAIRQIYATKGRPSGHPLIVHLAANADWEQWGVFSDLAMALAKEFWPGPLTMIVPRHPQVPTEVTGGLDTIGIRVPQHPIAQRLLSSFGSGIAAPSANRFGGVSPTTAHHVQAEFGDTIHIVDGGPSHIGIESTIVDLSGTSPALLRPGSITEAQIEAIVGPLGHSNTPAPGTLASHYSPHTSLLLSDNPTQDANRLESQGLSVAILHASAPENHARTLYAELRRLDQLGVDILVAERSPDQELGRAINDRLTRAGHGFSIGKKP
jgi:L-threonylcarbamoyladenylate synthase